MPKRRLEEARVLAAVAAIDPPCQPIIGMMTSGTRRRTCGRSSGASACFPMAHNVVASGMTGQGACAAGGGGSESCSVASKDAEARTCMQADRADTLRAHACWRAAMPEYVAGDDMPTDGDDGGAHPYHFTGDRLTGDLNYEGVNVEDPFDDCGLPFPLGPYIKDDEPA